MVIPEKIMKKFKWIPFAILLVFLIIGLLHYRDFGVSSDEPAQIEAGHIVWKYICQKLGLEVPKSIDYAQSLLTYKNRYYGQAATMPTVVIEALRGFTFDSYTIILIRHLWNFLSYFFGLCCFAATIGHIYKSHLKSALGLLFMIFLPRIFGDIFVNDRDTMLLAWMMISLASFCLYSQHPGWVSGFLCAFSFGITINVRLFGLVMLLFPLLFFGSSKHRKADILLISASLGFWLLVSPIYWENPLRSIVTSFYHLVKVQRMEDTKNLAELLFFGKFYNETDLPFWYLPAYIFVTTPVMTSFSCWAGIVFFAKGGDVREASPRKLIGIGMMLILFLSIFGVIVLRPALYNGWRHFYFLCLPIVWLALEGADHIIQSRLFPARIVYLILLGGSFICSALWMANAHPYYLIYINPAFRKQWADKFSRDFWGLAITDGMQYLLDNVDNYAIEVVDYNLFKIKQLGLEPSVRDRFHYYRYSIQPNPIEYEYFQYPEGFDEKTIDYYGPIYTIERDGVKLGEVFQRTHNFEIKGTDAIAWITSDRNPETASLMTDSDYATFWETDGESSEITMELKKDFLLSSIEVFPTIHYEAFPDFLLYSSEDGITWTQMDYIQKGGNGLEFQQVNTHWLKIKTGPETPGIRDFLFYGIPNI